MDKKKYNTGTLMHKAGDPVKNLEYICYGKVSVVSPAFTIELRKCSVIGLFEQAGETYRYDYIVSEDCDNVFFYPTCRWNNFVF